MPAQLVALNDGPSILLDKPILLLGRHPECDIQIESRKISRRHCRIAQVSDYLVVRDLGSTNGVRINGTRVLEGRLRQGDELTIGNHRYQLSWDSISGPASPPPRPRAKETFRAPVPANQMADELLESCDEPVPLLDPGPVAVVAPRAPSQVAAPPHKQVVPEDGSVLTPPKMPSVMPPPGEEDSLILPDHLELMPVSNDLFPKVPSHSRDSSRPPV